jgi:hypothetical protein
MKRKKLTSKKLFDFLNKLNKEGKDLSKIFVKYRFDDDSDVENCSVVEEDLYDKRTNKILESIILKTK